MNEDEMADAIDDLRNQVQVALMANATLFSAVLALVQTHPNPGALSVCMAGRAAADLGEAGQITRLFLLSPENGAGAHQLMERLSAHAGPDPSSREKTDPPAP